MSKKLNRAVESLSLASLQLASAIENLSAIAREEAGRAQNCSHPLSGLKIHTMAISEFAEICKKDAEPSGTVEEPNKPYGQTSNGDIYVGQTESSAKQPAQRITIPPIDLMAVSKGEIAKSQATSVETLSEADDNSEVGTLTETSEVAEHAMYFQHNGSDSIFMVKKGESLAFLATDDVSEISKSQYHRLKKQQEADEAADKLAAEAAAKFAAAKSAAAELAVEEPVDETADQPVDETVEEPADQPTNASDEAKNSAMFKLITKTLTQACNDTLITRVDIKKKLAKYEGATSISALTYDQKMDLWENWAKDFAEDDTLPF